MILNVIFFLSVGVLVLVFFIVVFFFGIGDSVVFGKVVGVLINGVDVFICFVWIIWFEEIRNISCSFIYISVFLGLFFLSILLFLCFYIVVVL